MPTATITDAQPWPYRIERSSALPADRPGFLAGVARTAYAALREYRERRAMRHLAALSDHMLRDIGLSRGEIERAVRTGRASAGERA